MEKTTLSLKVSKDFVERFRGFCETNALSIGRFAEQQLQEVMEDFYFGTEAQRVLSKGDTRRKSMAQISKARK